MAVNSDGRGWLLTVGVECEVCIRLLMGVEVQRGSLSESNGPQGCVNTLWGPGAAFGPTKRAGTRPVLIYMVIY